MTRLSELCAGRAGGGQPFTLLGAGPMSRLVVEAVVEAGAREDAPLVFIPSRNQVESDGLGSGYVEGWDQRDLCHYVRRQVQLRRFRGSCFVGRDHGGPWQRDDEYHAALDWDRALANAIASYQDDLDAGFSYLHVDTSRDPGCGAMVPLDLALARTVEVIRHTEAYRLRSGRGYVDYEVSLERTSGELSPPSEFARFVEQLVRDLDRARLPRPLFIVGNTGTLTRMDRNVGAVDFGAVAELTRIAREHGLVFKEHNADYLGVDDLARHPGAGIGMINVAPELAKLESDALLELCRQEEESLGAGHERLSHLREVLLHHVRHSTRWRKWVHEVDDRAGLFEDPAWVERVVAVNSHYFFRREDVREARRRLYNNCVLLGVCDDPHSCIKARVEKRLLRYLDSLNLRALGADDAVA